jgi:peroxiredoxin
MVQAQDAAYPRRGQMLPPFTLLSAAGGLVQLAAYRGRANLVVVLAGSETELLRHLAARHARVLEEEAQVIAVLCGAREQAQAIQLREQFPFLVLADPDCALHLALGALDSGGAPRLAVYVTDRWGEIFALWRAAHGDPVPGAQDIVSWLEFVNRQCPECFPPEWPA